MEASLINPQKPSALNKALFIDSRQQDQELQQLLKKGDASKVTIFLKKHPAFLLHRADEKLKNRLVQIYRTPVAQETLNSGQIRLLQDVQYLCRLDHQLQTLPLPAIHEAPKNLVQEINSLVPKKNRQLRQEARSRIIRRLVRRHLNEQCLWLKGKEAQITFGLEKALSNLFDVAFQIENENPKFLENSIRYTLPVLEQLGPHLQQVANLSQRAVQLATQVGRTAPTLNALTNRIFTQARLAPIRSNASITPTIDTYNNVYQQLLQQPVERAIRQEIRRETAKETADLSHLPYHPLLHGGTPQ
jgi:hypothetical protein